jgi:putative membrane protein
VKYLIRIFLFNVFAIWATSALLPSFAISDAWQVISFAGLVLTILMVFVKPVLKILFIPINILTLGVMSWFINVIMIYLLTVLVPEIEITAWTFPGWHNHGFALGKVYLPYIANLILASVVLTCISNVLHRVSED